MAEYWIPGDKKELLSAIEREWTLLMEIVARLDEAQMTAPDAGGWSPKDNLAHLAEWMKIQLGYHMDRRPAHEVMGVPPEVTAGDWDFDAINRVLLEKNRNRAVEDVLGELKRVYAQTLERVNSTPFEELLKPRWPDHPDSLPVLAYLIGNTSGHFAEHRETIEKTLKE
ncbi:MAG: ClbS/DfsB family four-helix bundle protein [Chloroflexota bacterium]